jgi:flagellar biosynthetic protein FliQ
VTGVLATMDQDTVVSLATNALTLCMKIALPLLLVGLIVGLIISIFQSVTQIQEQTLTFIPKIVATFAVLLIAGPWMLNQLVAYSQELWLSIPRMVGHG